MIGLTLWYFSAPPSYSECVSGPVRLEGGEGEDDEENPVPQANWTPAYPVYNYTHQINQVNDQGGLPSAPPAYDEIQFSQIR